MYNVGKPPQSTSKQPSPLPTLSTPSPDPNSEPKRPNPPSKRKSNSVNGKLSRNSKKAKILPGRVPTTARYFESKNMGEGGEDVIMLRSSSDSEPDVQAKLALDSSDDPEAEETQNPLVSIELPLYLQPSRSESSQLSTFRPTRDLNVYELSADEASALGLQNETSVLSIDREETLALLGACTLTILKGSVFILGVTLSARRNLRDEAHTNSSSPGLMMGHSNTRSH
ncbi:uncharacterized protein BJ212DRAFT_1480054 [Suillus subaureus]|uniref:Uncharacterized protein n=1 Tax=Suillus subaureus TaxID=48587 RepID=A0A9P7EBY0_9AGAM|nr:uncharacterized protein BJ212DRAFT_1480054 [Suillus subaureus]KAG1817486.1 hypothetical protein BJ212DRAFT_1480054 [Suillus subaureus]